MDELSDTIAAIATAPGEAGISIVRIAGPASLGIADKIFQGKRAPSSVPANGFVHGVIRSPAPDGMRGGDVDEVILLVYRAPHSYTREDVVEIQGHGGRTSARRILKMVLDAGARTAEPGEFTKRAFLNGRIDLLQAEAVLDLIRAQSDRSAAAAVEQLEGSLSNVLSVIYDDMMSVAAELEVSLDFSEDELPANTMGSIVERFEGVIGRLQAVLATWHEGHLLREGALVVIAGKPNVGKSTLLNTLLGRDRAIVTEIPGTTRDTIEEQWILEGVPVRLVDTAGLRDSECRVEQEGIQRAQSSVENADLVVYVIDCSQQIDTDDVVRIAQAGCSRCVVVLNKSDLGSVLNEDSFPGFRAVTCSLLNGKGIDGLRAAILEALGARTQGLAHAVISERHRIAIQGAVDKATEAFDLLKTGRDDVVTIAANVIRSSLEQIGTVTGKVYSKELLYNVFSKFCIGK